MKPIERPAPRMKVSYPLGEKGKIAQRVYGREEWLSLDVLSFRDPEWAVNPATGAAYPERYRSDFSAELAAAYGRTALRRLEWIHQAFDPACMTSIHARVFPGPGGRATTRGSATWWQVDLPTFTGVADVRMNEKGTVVSWFGHEEASGIFANDKHYRPDFERYGPREQVPLMWFDIKGYCIRVDERETRRKLGLGSGRRSLELAVRETAAALDEHLDHVHLHELENVIAARVTREIRELEKFAGAMAKNKSVVFPSWIYLEINRLIREKTRKTPVVAVDERDLGRVASVTFSAGVMTLKTETEAVIDIRDGAEMRIADRYEKLWPEPESWQLIDHISKSSIDALIQESGGDMVVKIGNFDIVVRDPEKNFGMKLPPVSPTVEGCREQR